MDDAGEQSLAILARICLDNFARLTTLLNATGAENQDVMPPDKLEWQLGRFNIWCGNLGALQSGKSSLDARLRESTVIRTNLSKHLDRLNASIVGGIEIISGMRLPFEKQSAVDEVLQDESTDDSEDDDEPPKELAFHMTMIEEILNDLHMLSFKIRGVSTRPNTSLRMQRYTEVDDETGIDVFAAYSEFDRRYIEDTMLELRRDTVRAQMRRVSDIARIVESDRYLVDRLVDAMSLPVAQ